MTAATAGAARHLLRARLRSRSRPSMSPEAALWAAAGIGPARDLLAGDGQQRRQDGNDDHGQLPQTRPAGGTPSCRAAGARRTELG